MLRFIEKMRSKTENERKSFAFLATSIFTGLVAAAWFLSFGPFFSNKVNNNSASVVGELSPFAKIGNFAKDAFSGLGSSFNELGNVLGSSQIEINNEVKNITATSTKDVENAGR